MGIDSGWGGRPELLVLGVILVLGRVLRRPFSAALVSAVKAVLGCLMLWWATAYPVNAALEYLTRLGQAAAGLRLVLPLNELAVVPLLAQRGFDSLFIFFAGNLLALLLARLLPRRYVFLSGHHSLFMAVLLASALTGLRLPAAAVWLTGVGLLAALQALLPWAAQPLVRRLTGSDDLSLGHFNLLGYAVGAACAWAFARLRPASAAPDSEPRAAELVKEPLAATAVLTGLVFFTLGAWNAAPGRAADSFYAALLLAVGLGIATYGARLLVSESIPLFQHLSERIAPGAAPAVDVPALFAFAPGAVFPGFLGSLAGGVVGMAIQALTGLPLILPSLVPHYFTGAAAGVIGSIWGGRRGAAVAGFANGLLISLLAVPLWLLQGANATTFSDADYQWVGILLGLLQRLLGR